MRLLSIAAKDFLSYRDLDVDLSTIRQVAIVGRNGSGKSAILDAVLWNLFAKGRGSTDELVREGTPGCWVKTTWERKVRGVPTTVTITRSRSRDSEESSLSIDVDGVTKTKAKIPDTQREIERLVGMSYDAMTAGPVMAQDESAALMKAKPAERKDLLVTLFQLDRWERYHAEATSRLKAGKVRLDQVHEELRTIDEFLGEVDILAVRRELDEDKGNLATSIREREEAAERLTRYREEAAVLLDRSRRAESLAADQQKLAKRIDAKGQELIRLNESAAEHRETLKLPALVKPDPPDLSILNSLQHERTELAGTLATLRGRKEHLARLEQKVVEAEAKIADVHVCEGNPPGCQFEQLRQRLGTERDEMVDEAAGIRSELMELPLLEARWSELEPEIIEAERLVSEGRALMSRHDKLEAQRSAAIDAATAWLADFDQRLTAVANERDDAKDEHTRITRELAQLSQDEFRKDELAGLIRTETSTVTDLTGSITNLEKAITTNERVIEETSKMERRRVELIARSGEITTSLTSLEALTRAFHRDGIPTLILETSLPEIEQRANAILEQLPDDYSIRMDTTKATKAGTLKDELQIIVTTGGRERAYHLLSGGQRFRVDFAVRIALAAVIAARVEASVDTLWLDEPLGSLDRWGQEAVAETLDAVANDFGIILVVSHVADFNDRFEARLSVSMDDDLSTARLN